MVSSQNVNILHSLLYPGRPQKDIPTDIPKEVVEAMYRRLCEERVGLSFTGLLNMVNGKEEPTDEQISDWSRALNIYNGTWKTVD